MSAPATARIFGGLISLFYPASCAGCSAATDAGEHLCAKCKAVAPKIKAPYCDKCSEPFPGAITEKFSCANCTHRVLHFDAAVSAYRARGVVRELIHEFKYGQQLYLRYPIGEWLAAALDDIRLAGRRFDLLVPVPLHPARQRERGFNQAALLAETLQKHSGILVRTVLDRIRYTTTQTQFDRFQRMENLKDAFRLRKGCDVQRLRVFLIDDVLTTGSTLSECALMLKRAGALSVHAATAARG
jgi:competence protein ComFC